MKMLPTHSVSAKVSSHTDRRRLLFMILLSVAILVAETGLGGMIAPVQAQTSPLVLQPSTGQVGIGVADPNYTLDVNGTVNAASFRGDGSQLTNLPAGGSQWTTSGSAIYYNAGKVGMGTTTPGAPLDVVANSSPTLRIADAGNGDPQLTIQKSGLNTLSLFARNGYDQITTSDPIPLNFTGFSGITFGGALGATAGGVVGISGNLAVGASYYMTEPPTNGVIIQGSVGVGTTNPTSTLHVNGTLTASVKNFQVPHPLDPDRRVLVHSSLEGPEVGVYYRGEARLDKGEAEVALPAYFEALTIKERRTVQLTPLDGWSPLYVVKGVEDGTFTVRTAQGGDPAQRFYWEVKAVRADVPSIEVEKDKPVEREPKPMVDPRR